MRRIHPFFLATGLAFILSACGSPAEQESAVEPAVVVDGNALTDLTADSSDTVGAPVGGIDVDVDETGTVMQLSPEEQAGLDLVNAGDRVFFEYDKSTFSAEGEATLRAQGELLLNAPGVTVTIEGHCDERGTREYNIALGERRAEAVKGFLVSLGVEAERISTISYGKERPVVAGHDEESWRQNRVAITVVNP